RGFDWFYGLLQGSRGYFPAKAPTPHQVIQENGKPTEESGYVTDRFGDAAVRFITEHREQPFFLFVSFTAPHGPLQPKQEDFDALTQFQQLRRRRYAGLIRSLDANVGKVLAALDALGLADHTLVVFTNDNGGQTLTGANNQPLRGRKGQLVEGGIRVPMCMRWPGRIRAGSVVEDPVISLDLLPTFVRAGGGTVDPAWRLDGVDLLPRLTGVSAALPERPLFWRFGGPGGAAAVRLGRYKLLIADRAKSSEPELYDLAADLGEARDLAGQPVHAELRGKLHGLLTGWEKELVEPSWTYGRRQDRRK
ncbi:MAG: sulfatase-like hydrolase/transferase, partial [Planctomycetes bacterium]|nr:sulfatase-like hydrolase/transferase [Planctomycetota bacterium]